MFIGHFGIGFGAEAAALRVSLGTLFLAAESPCCAGPRTGDARSLAARTPGFLGRFTPQQQNGGMARISKKKLDLLPSCGFNAGSLELKLQNDAVRYCHIRFWVLERTVGQSPFIFLG